MEKGRNAGNGVGSAMDGGGKPEEISQSLPIPDYKMGWIVGKRGSYVQQLCEKSGARIAISESTSREFGIVWKYVQISGSGREVDKAKKLIHIRLDRLDRGSGGGASVAGGGGKKGGESGSSPSSGSDEAAGGRSGGSAGPVAGK